MWCIKGNIAAGRDSKSNGFGINPNISYTLDGTHVPTVTHNAFDITFNDANGRRKDRPNGGCYINNTHVATSITTSGVECTKIIESIQHECAPKTEALVAQEYVKNDHQGISTHKYVVENRVLLTVANRANNQYDKEE